MGIWNQFLWSLWYPLKKGQRMPVLEYHLWLAWTSSQIWRMCSMELDSDIKHHAVSWDVATYQSQLFGDAGGYVPDLCWWFVSYQWKSFGDTNVITRFSLSFVHQKGHFDQIRCRSIFPAHTWERGRDNEEQESVHLIGVCLNMCTYKHLHMYIYTYLYTFLYLFIYSIVCLFIYLFVCSLIFGCFWIVWLCQNQNMYVYTLNIFELHTIMFFRPSL